MNEKQLEAIKAAKKKIVDGSLTIWNARLDALSEGGHEMDLINFAGNSVEDIGLTNVCGCPEPGSPKCGCKPFDPFDFDNRINEIGQMVNEIRVELKGLKGKVK